ncbi:radical SAM protein [Candidatus Poribacteria bacterium]|nr:radical SAM protein [Candidatus Poribacteria bacterium]
MKYTFGPVPSRRLGMSLGVDIIPFKFCSFDCIYCQLGVTTDKSIERKSYVPAEEVLSELKDVVSEDAERIDFITFSGSGEPTLNSDIGKMVNSIKVFTDIPVAVLTNGSLLYREDVRNDLINADLIVPSLDAISQDTLEKVNRSHPELDINEITQGLRDFTGFYKGRIWLEIMLVNGVNDDFRELENVAMMIKDLNLEKIHLNTVVRPPAEESAMAIDKQKMQEIAAIFDDRAEIIVDFDKVIAQKANADEIESMISSMLKRRPCTIDDISSSLGIHKNEAIKHVNHLSAKSKIRNVRHQDKWYYEVC